MNTPALVDTAQAMLAPGKGLLAMDESPSTCDRRLAAAGIAQTLEMRRAYRQLLLGTPDLNAHISGVILCDETLHQTAAAGTPLPQVARDAGLRVGIKVDTGARALAAHPGEQVTEGLDGLRERLQAYRALGACFAKWRAVFALLDPGLPSAACVAANAHALARYAALCQEAGLLPIVEPEVLMDGAHSRQRCQETSERVLHAVFEHLVQQGVALEAVILKPNMVTSGSSCATQDSAADVAAATLQVLRRAVPAAVPGILFLSGGQAGALASSRLDAMHRGRGLARDDRSAGPALPWTLSFSFGRALQQPALAIWAGDDRNRVAAQQALLHRARCNGAAAAGRYDATLETP